jgi:hypothetical protein
MKSKSTSLHQALIFEYLEELLDLMIIFHQKKRNKRCCGNNYCSRRKINGMNHAKKRFFNKYLK